MSTTICSYAYKTTPGPMVNVNEDLVEINLVNNIYMVMDGFGGSGIGDVTTKTIRDGIINFYANTSSDPDSTLPYFFEPKYTLELNVLINAIHHVHKEFQKENLSKSINLRGGASIIIGLYVDSLLMLVSIGNCSCMLGKKGQLIRLVRPESLVDTLIKDEENHLKLFPTNAFGLFDKLNLNIMELRVDPGDQVIMCTDGVYTHMDLDEMNYILSKNHVTNLEKVQEVIDLANLRGNWDNQSLLLLNF